VTQPLLLSLLLHRQQPVIARPALGRHGQGSGQIGSSILRWSGPLAPPSSQVQVTLKQRGQAGDS
ncbi:hypothetical protein KIN20_028372, partial [Parelaphostrongylus tenuis]